VKGKCWGNYSDAHAKTEIEAYVNSYKTQTTKCAIKEKTIGSADVEGEGKAKTKVKRPYM
jgi:hypothetical protein